VPVKPARPCKHNGCPSLTNDPTRYCAEHKRQAQQEQDRERGTAAERGYTYQWSKVRKMYLNEFPLCNDCEQVGKVTSATEVHHIKPIGEGGNNERDNLMSLCHVCHSRRTAKEQGFARPTTRRQHERAHLVEREGYCKSL
jgi:5-methylcytosine-specific restriction protein A